MSEYQEDSQDEPLYKLRSEILSIRQTIAERDREIEYLRERLETEKFTVSGLVDKIQSLESQLCKARELIDFIQWNGDRDGDKCCVYCASYKSKHYSGCAIEKYLNADELGKMRGEGMKLRYKIMLAVVSLAMTNGGLFLGVHDWRKVLGCELFIFGSFGLCVTGAAILYGCLLL